jgi:hypothetical protein
MEGTMRLNCCWLQFEKRRHYRFAALLVVLIGLAGLSLWLADGNVRAQGDLVTPASGTIPPGGTIPPPVPDPTNGQVRVVHLAPFDNVIANTAVDICREDNTPISGFTGLLYLSETGYLPFTFGNYNWKVMTPGCGALVTDIPPFTLNAGAALTLYITGDGNNQPITTLLSVEAQGLTERRFLPLIAVTNQPYPNRRPVAADLYVGQNRRSPSTE